MICSEYVRDLDRCSKIVNDKQQPIQLDRTEIRDRGYSYSIGSLFVSIRKTTLVSMYAARSLH